MDVKNAVSLLKNIYFIRMHIQNDYTTDLHEYYFMGEGDRSEGLFYNSVDMSSPL